MTSDPQALVKRINSGKRVKEAETIGLLRSLVYDKISQEIQEPAIDALDKHVKQLRKKESSNKRQRNATRDLNMTLVIKARSYLDTMPQLSFTQALSEEDLLKLIESWRENDDVKNHLDESNRQERPNSRRNDRIRETAKVMVISPKLQKAIRAFRRDHGIKPQSLKKAPAGASPEYLLIDRVLSKKPEFTSSYDNQIEMWECLQDELKARLFIPFQGLDWQLHYGLIVTALLFNLTSDEVIQEASWEKILHISCYQSSAEDIEVLNDLTSMWAGALLCIAYLAANQREAISGIPEISGWVSVSDGLVARLGGVDRSSIPSIIKSIYGKPDSKPVPGKLQSRGLILRIHDDSIKADIDYYWPRINIHKRALWNTNYKQRRKWPTYERDATVWTLSKKYKGDELVEAYRKEQEKKAAGKGNGIVTGYPPDDKALVESILKSTGKYISEFEGN